MSKKSRFQKGADIQQGESQWIYSYADMMSLLFCFFVILHSFNHVDDNRMEDITKQLSEAFKGETQQQSKKDFDEQKERISEDELVETFKMLVSQSKFGISQKEVVRAIKNRAKDKAVMDETKEKIQEELQGNNYIEVGQLQDIGFDLALPGDILFKADSFQLTQRGTQVLNDLVATLNTFSDIIQIEVIGHSSSSHKKDEFKELTLSAQSAAKVSQIMIESGMPKELITVRAKGDAEPLFPNRNDDGKLIWANLVKNNRVHLVVKRKP